MKVLMAIYGLNNLGGIVNFITDLSYGFAELGHEVDLVQPLYQGKFINKKYGPEVYDKLKNDGWEYNEVLRMWYSQYSGYFFDQPYVNKKPYYGEENIKAWQDYASGYDLVIWIVTVPTKKAENRGNLDWIKLYDLGPNTKQVGIVHDGNLNKAYPWMYEVRERLSGIACVHGAAFHSADSMPIFRSLIVNPQDLNKAQLGLGYRERERAWYSGQTFKAWKRVPNLCRAIPHMSNETGKYLAGGGLDYAYMTSPDKTKHNYFVRREDDPDLPMDVEDGSIRIWDRALNHGMNFLGFIPQTQRDEILDRVRVLIDPSWSLQYAKLGDHFNRVVIDAAKRGAIPVAFNYGIATNDAGIGEVFRPDENYIMIPYDATPKEYADRVEYSLNLPNDLAEKIRFNNFELCKKFDRRIVAQRYIDLSNNIENPDTSILRKEEYVTLAGPGLDAQVTRDNSRHYMNTFFADNYQGDLSYFDGYSFRSK